MARLSVHIDFPILEMGEGHGVFDLAGLTRLSHIDLVYFMEICAKFVATAPGTTKHMLELKCNAKIDANCPVQTKCLAPVNLFHEWVRLGNI